MITRTIVENQVDGEMVVKNEKGVFEQKHFHAVVFCATKDIPDEVAKVFPNACLQIQSVNSQSSTYGMDEATFMQHAALLKIDGKAVPTPDASCKCEAASIDV